MSASIDKPIKSKRPWLAGILNVIIPGLGHIYLKNWRRGIATFLATIALLFIATYDNFVVGTAVYVFSVNQNLCVGSLLIALIAVLFWDGYKAAKKI